MDKTEQILQAAKEGAKKYFDEQVSLLTKFSSIDCGTGDEEGNKKIVNKETYNKLVEGLKKLEGIIK